MLAKNHVAGSGCACLHNMHSTSRQPAANAAANNALTASQPVALPACRSPVTLASGLGGSAGAMRLMIHKLFITNADQQQPNHLIFLSEASAEELFMSCSAVPAQLHLVMSPLRDRRVCRVASVNAAAEHNAHRCLRFCTKSVRGVASVQRSK